MSRLISSKTCVAFIILSLSVLSSTILLAGQADRKNESRSHISLPSKAYTPLTLDDVIPGDQSVFIQPTPTQSTTTQPSTETEAREPILIRVTGYSAYESKEDAKSESKRLLAQRASKLDAYRALSERVYGVSVKGESAVKDFAMKEDRFSVGFDSFVRGARVVSISEKKDVGFETVLELVLPGSFNDCINKVNNFKNGLNCLRPLPSTSFFLNESKGEAEGKSKSGHSKGFQGSGYFLR